MADLSKIPLSRIQDFTDIIDNKQNKLIAGTNITIDNTNPDSPIQTSPYLELKRSQVLL